MTTQWLIFSTVLPAAVAAIGWLAVLFHERQLRRDLEREVRPKRRRIAAHPGSSTSFAAFSIAASAPDPPRSGCTRFISRR